MMRWASRLVGALLLAALGLGLGAPLASNAQGPAPAKKAKPKVEVVFCLDTTGSMGGLIDGAKAKIWSICNQIAAGKPAPDLKVGLVQYRDRGDSFVTKVYDLTDDLDNVHATLKTFTADEGGDHPESVNQALYDSVHKVKWSKDNKTLRIIFLVGDAPPHMDYPDDVKYPVTCQEAVKKGIIVNTIQCGSDGSCMKYWKDICVKAEGSYLQIEQRGGVVSVDTPFDKRLAEINGELARSTVVFGGEAKRAKGKKSAGEAATLPPGAAADRAGFAGRSGKAAAYDLIDAIRDGKADLAKLKDKELPEELAKLKTVPERKAYLDKIETRRKALNKEAVELDTKRQAFIKRELERLGKGKDSFDSGVLDMVRKQAKKHGIDY